jgi:hypothetical protein
MGKGCAQRGHCSPPRRQISAGASVISSPCFGDILFQVRGYGVGSFPQSARAGQLPAELPSEGTRRTTFCGGKERPTLGLSQLFRGAKAKVNSARLTISAVRPADDVRLMGDV